MASITMILSGLLTGLDVYDEIGDCRAGSRCRDRIAIHGGSSPEYKQEGFIIGIG